MKAKKRKLAVVRVHACAREENRGEVLPKQDTFSSIVLVFRAEQVVFSRRADCGGEIGGYGKREDKLFCLRAFLEV